MNKVKRYVILSLLCVMFAVPSRGQAEVAPVPNLVTADIQAAIEKHIEDETIRGEGYFRFSSEGKDYSFKLVRVHTEYLADLGAGRYFACVDMADTSGDVYDLDFFLSGNPESMDVNEITLHKLNGIPFYSWQQDSKGKWERVPIKNATPKLLGVMIGKDEFEFLYRIELPELKGAARMWVPVARSDAFQKVELTNMDSLEKYSILEDATEGNKVLFFELGPEDSGKTIDIKYQVARIEKAAYKPEADDWQKSLEADRLVPISDNFRKEAEEVVAGKKGDLVRARALYDHIIDRMRYIKYGEGWGQGDAVYACDARTGNCTDFHAYFIALARAVGIPARFAIGAAIPSERNEGGVDGYHCWVEFYAEGKWWPIDISEADKYSILSTYYFGHNPANRFELSRGRDLVVEPGPSSGPINFHAYPVLEVEGEQVPVKPWFSFKRKVPQK